MQNLYRNFRLQLELVSTDFIRFLHDKIAWDSRLIAIVGSRGVGKTTLLLQHIKKYEKAEDVLYITADDFYFTNHRLFDLAYQFYTQGGKKLFIDEIHKYKGWSTEIKKHLRPDTRPPCRLHRIIHSGFRKRRCRLESKESGVSPARSLF